MAMQFPQVEVEERVPVGEQHVPPRPFRSLPEASYSDMVMPMTSEP